MNEKKKQRDDAWGKREAILGVLGTRSHYYYYNRWIVDENTTALDPRWLDLAVEMEHFGLVQQLIRPGHQGANDMLQELFRDTLKKGKHIHEFHAIVSCMIRAGHPEATDSVIAVLEKFGKKADYFGYWFGSLIVDLPKAALPRLEALIPTLNDKIADGLIGYIQQLREKKD